MPGCLPFKFKTLLYDCSKANVDSQVEFENESMKECEMFFTCFMGFSRWCNRSYLNSWLLLTAALVWSKENNSVLKWKPDELTFLQLCSTNWLRDVQTGRVRENVNPTRLELKRMQGKRFVLKGAPSISNLHLVNT